MAYDYVLAVGGSAGSTLGGSSFGRPQRAAGSSCRRTLICCRNVQISASSITRDRIRSTTIQPMSLQGSLIAHDHRPILDRLPSRIRFATGTPWKGRFFVRLPSFFAAPEQRRTKAIARRIVLSMVSLSQTLSCLAGDRESDDDRAQ